MFHNNNNNNNNNSYDTYKSCLVEGNVTIRENRNASLNRRAF